MGRKKLDAGHTVNVTAKVSPQQVEAIEAARNGRSRSATIADALAIVFPVGPPPPPPASRTATELPAKACKHPRALKGWCNDCKTGGHF